MLPDEVMTTLGVLSKIRSARASALKPPNTTLCTAPMRAQASCTVREGDQEWEHGMNQNERRASLGLQIH